MAALILQSPEGVQTYVLGRTETVIGRAPGLEIRLEGGRISRRHARIERVGNAYLIEDLGSSNGTFVNGQRVLSRTALSARDVINIGGFSLRFEDESADQREVTIHTETLASPENKEIFRDNPQEKLQAIMQIAHVLAHTLEMDLLLERFIDQILKFFPKAERALVFLVENGEAKVRLVRDKRARKEGEVLYSRSVLSKVIDTGSAVLATETQAVDPSKSLVELGVRSFLCVPLRAARTPVFGAVQLDRFQSGNSFSGEDLNFLAAVTMQISLGLESARMHQRIVAQERIAKEVALAREIQLASLPSSRPTGAEKAVDLHAELHPAEEISGDFYDFFNVDQSRLALVVGDVSGKGIAAALFMSMARAQLRRYCSAELGPAEILARVNEEIASENPKCMFVTMVLAIYSVGSGECVFARAGHPGPLVLTAGGEARMVDSAAGSLLGIEQPCPRLQESKIKLGPGETLLLYTDGITEAAAENGQMFGCQRLIETVRAAGGKGSLKEMAAHLVAQVRKFCQGSKPQDDITLLLVRKSL